MIMVYYIVTKTKMFDAHHYSVSALYRQPTESMKGFLSKRWSFWLALFSCAAFLVGNMVGQHGWGAFWKSVWGQEAEIVFTGAVSPLPVVPDPGRWGGGNRNFDFTDVPEELLVSLPSYLPARGCGDDAGHNRSILSVDYNGDYDSGGLNCGSHPAADLLTPKGTPVVSVMNGVVTRVVGRGYGFGNTVVIKHPGVPNVDDPDKTEVLYSNYAHLGKMYVSIGEIVQKGQQIALTGQTGFATAPHLHFQIDREAPFHPYWPFTTSEATEAGLSFIEAVDNGLGKDRAEQYTINPLAYIENYRDWGMENGMAIVKSEKQEELSSEEITASVVLSGKTFIEKLRENVAARIARRRSNKEQVIVSEVVEGVDSNVDSELFIEPEEEAIEDKGVIEVEDPTSSSAVADELRGAGEDESEIAESRSTAETDMQMPKVSHVVSSITILHDGDFDKDWEEIVLYARDEDGNFIKNVKFEGEIHLQASFGEADFSPSVITQEQFDSRGRAFIRMIPRGIKTVIPAVRGAFTADGEPMTNMRILSARSDSKEEGG